MDLTSAGIHYDAESDVLVDQSGTPLSQTSYAQFVDAQGGSADPVEDGEEEDDEGGDEEEEEEETEETESTFRKS
jgi:hypothetical protein